MMSPKRRRTSAPTFCGLADNGERVQHGVVDESGHRVPGIDFGQSVQFRVQIAPAVQVEHAAVCRSRAIERNLTRRTAAAASDQRAFVQPVTTKPE